MSVYKRQRGSRVEMPTNNVRQQLAKGLIENILEGYTILIENIHLITMNSLVLSKTSLLVNRNNSARTDILNVHPIPDTVIDVNLC